MVDVVSPAERELVAEARLDDLNLNVVREHIETAVTRRGYEGPTDTTAYLLRHHAIMRQDDDTFTPTLTGVVAFARDPERWIHASGVDFAQFRSTQSHSTSLDFSRQIRGSLMSLIDQTVEVLWTRSEHRYHIDGTERVEEHAYPLVVLRELSANAIAHRDWQYRGTRVRIQMFPDRIEWISPGGLPPGVTAERLREEQALRNPALAQILYQSGKIESFGMGIDTVEDTLRAWGCKPMVVHNSSRHVTFTVFAKSLVVSTARPTADDREATILRLIAQRGPLGIAEMLQYLEVSRRTLQYDLGKMVERGVLVVTGLTNNRRYHHTPQDK